MLNENERYNPDVDGAWTHYDSYPFPEPAANLENPYAHGPIGLYDVGWGGSLVGLKGHSIRPSRLVGGLDGHSIRPSRLIGGMLGGLAGHSIRPSRLVGGLDGHSIRPSRLVGGLAGPLMAGGESAVNDMSNLLRNHSTLVLGAVALYAVSDYFSKK